VRNVQSSGFEDTWTDARRATASFLSEGGTFTGIANIERGITTEVQPFITAQWNGVRNATGGFDREDVNPDAGVNLKVALPSVTLDATVKPDFSQVESDASLVTVNERFALFFAEKRPFFLEGIELFNTPNQLVYTRQIASPVAGAKVTGKLGAISVAYLSALDDTSCPARFLNGVQFKPDCDKALFNVARLRRDFGGNSTIALTVTDRRAGDTTNTVIASDLRYVFGRMYYFETQFGGSYTKDAALLGTQKGRTSPRPIPALATSRILEARSARIASRARGGVWVKFGRYLRAAEFLTIDATLASGRAATPSDCEASLRSRWIRAKVFLRSVSKLGV